MNERRLIERWLPIGAIGEESVKGTACPISPPCSLLSPRVVGTASVDRLSGQRCWRPCCRRAQPTMNLCLCSGLTVIRSLHERK